MERKTWLEAAGRGPPCAAASAAPATKPSRSIPLTFFCSCGPPMACLSAAFAASIPWKSSVLDGLAQPHRSWRHESRSRGRRRLSDWEAFSPSFPTSASWPASPCAPFRSSASCTASNTTRTRKPLNSGSPPPAPQGVDVSRELLEKEVVNRFVPRVIRRMAVQASGEVVEKWAGRVIPIASSLIGAVLNYYFVRAWGRTCPGTLSAEAPWRCAAIVWKPASQACRSDRRIP